MSMSRWMEYLYIYASSTHTYHLSSDKLFIYIASKQANKLTITTPRIKEKKAISIHPSIIPTQHIPTFLPPLSPPYLSLLSYSPPLPICFPSASYLLLHPFTAKLTHIRTDTYCTKKANKQLTICVFTSSYIYIFPPLLSPLLILILTSISTSEFPFPFPSPSPSHPIPSIPSHSSYPTPYMHTSKNIKNQRRRECSAA
jgi:hypothetical protein